MGLGIAIAYNGKSDAELNMAARVEVLEQLGAPTRYRLNYPVDISDGDIPMLNDERFTVGAELSVLVPTASGDICLVKGPVTGQQVSLVHGGMGSTLQVLGADRLVEMDREARSVVWSETKDSDVLNAIVAGYAFASDVESTTGFHAEDKHALVQRDSDLRFIQRLARRNGFLLWLTTERHGVDTVHFKRPPLSDPELVDLTINLTNPSIDNLHIEWDAERPVSVDAKQLDLNTLEVLDGSSPGTPQTLLGKSSLASAGAGNRTLQLSSPADDSGDLRARADGVLIESDWFIRARCTTSIAAIGAPARAHTMVKVKGAGRRHSGPYFVSSVRHTIDSGSHMMDIEIVRNAWGN